MNEPFDAVVIGGGPAGSVATILLAQLGWRMALIERRETGTGKTCGHCLSDRAIPILASIGLEPLIRDVAVGDIRALSAYISRSTRASSLSSSRATFPAPALLTPRDLLDHRLICEAQARGATVIQPATATITRASSSNRHQHDIIIRRANGRDTHHAKRLRTRFIIGADGLRSRVAAAFGLHSPQRPGRKFGFSFRVSGDALRERQCMVMHGLYDTISMFITPHGYLGLVRESGGALHCAALVQAAGGRRTRRDPATFLASMHEEFPQVRQLMEAHGSPHPSPPLIAAGPMPCRPARLADHGVALIGDAAGYVEPFTGEGMTLAIESAIMLAEVCESITPGRWTDRDAARYEAHYGERIARRQRLCRLISYGLERPWMWRAALGNRAISAFLGRHVAERLQSRRCQTTLKPQINTDDRR